MTQQTRLKRPTPARTAPIRNLTKAFQQHGSQTSPEQPAPDSAKAEESGLRDAVSEGVRLGYSVIEDQIRQAQNLAGSLNPGGGDRDGDVSEIRPLIGRMLRTYGDLTSVWIELINAATGNADLMNLVMGRGKSQQADHGVKTTNDHAQANSPAGPRPISVNVVTDCPTETKIELFPVSGDVTAFAAQDLRSRESGKPPLDDVVILPAEPDGAVRLRVTVPSEQPAGLYQGLIVDARTDAPVGALSVTILS